VRFEEGTLVVAPQGAFAVTLGLALVVLGALGASLVHGGAARPTLRRASGLVPFGVLMGAGASLVRGWELTPSLIIGALLVPLVGIGGDLLAARRRPRGGSGAPGHG
jgi:hypothetical protein